MRAEVYFESRQKDQNRRSACVGQADFGKLGLNNIRNDSGNSQHLSVLSVKRDQFETRSIAAEINVLECSHHFKAFTHPLPPPGLVCVMQDLKL